MPERKLIKTSYEKLKKNVNRHGFGEESHLLIEDLFNASVAILAICERTVLISKVKHKSYFSFVLGGEKSRPINTELYYLEPTTAFGIFRDILRGKRHAHESSRITQAIYIVAITCCASIDVTKKSDRKTQGTIFEWLCASLMQSILDVRPARSIEVMNLDLRFGLPTDFIFDLGAEKPKFHLPVKTSTRERIIQVWAHQRVLDGVYGVGRFLAIPMILTETKLDLKKLEVTEICLPFQWRLYQMHISNLWNVCYFDAPEAYLDLDSVFPPVGVLTIGDFLMKGGRLDQLLEKHDLVKA